MHAEDGALNCGDGATWVCQHRWPEIANMVSPAVICTSGHLQSAYSDLFIFRMLSLVFTHAPSNMMAPYVSTCFSPS